MDSFFEGKVHAKTYFDHRPSPPDNLIQDVLDFVGPERRDLLLDVGCGSGQATIHFAEKFKKTVGVDISEAQLDFAKTRPEFKGLDVTFLQGSGNDPFPVEPESVDLVLCVAAAHWMDLPKFFANIKKALKPGGVCAITDYSAYDSYPDHPLHGEALRRFKDELFDTLKEFRSTKSLMSFDDVFEIPKKEYSNVIQKGNVEKLGKDYESLLCSNLEHYLGFLDSLSFFQTAREALGDEKYSIILDDFAKKVTKLLEYPDATNPRDVSFPAKIVFELGMFKK